MRVIGWLWMVCLRVGRWEVHASLRRRRGGRALFHPLHGSHPLTRQGGCGGGEGVARCAWDAETRGACRRRRRRPEAFGTPVTKMWECDGARKGAKGKTRR